MNGSAHDAPRIALDHLDELWLQVTGTRCNLTCAHCFISCSPTNDRFGFMTRAAVQRALADAAAAGVREFYFTGGEPMLHPEIVELLGDALAVGPVTVLTNGTVLRPEWLARLRALEAAGPYSLEFRVSIDGPSAEVNDPIRGEGTFDRALRGVRRLVEHDFLPIITMARTWPEHDDFAVLQRFRDRLRREGYNRPRLKILPTLRLGAEVARTRGYAADERVTAALLEGFDTSTLICSHSRVATDRGVYVCPILIEAADARLGATLAEAARPFALSHGACYTCYQFGAICTNPATSARETVHGSHAPPARDASR